MLIIKNWPDMNLSDLASWVIQEARQSEHPAEDFAQEVENILGAEYSDAELADIVRQWAYDYALVVKEEKDNAVEKSPNIAHSGSQS